MTANQNNTINEISKEVKIDVLKTAFEQSRQNHTELVNNLANIRNVANYVVTAVIIFTGYVISDPNYISNLTQQSIFYILLISILSLWVWINLSVRISIGYDPYEIIETIKKIDALDSDIINNPTSNFNFKNKDIMLYELSLKAQTVEYSKASSILNKQNKRQSVLLVLSLIFLITTMAFLRFKNFEINLNIIF